MANFKCDIQKWMKNQNLRCHQRGFEAVRVVLHYCRAHLDIKVNKKKFILIVKQVPIAHLKTIRRWMINLRTFFFYEICQSAEAGEPKHIFLLQNLGLVNLRVACSKTIIRQLLAISTNHLLICTNTVSCYFLILKFLC